MDSSTQRQTTLLLQRACNGDPSAAAELLPLVYDDLRALAAKHFRHQPPNHTLQPTALVHEAYVRLVQHQNVGWNGRTHFFATAAKAMRQILIDHGRRPKPVSICVEPLSNKEHDLSDVLEALEQLEELNPRHYQVVVLRFFGGLNVKEVATELGQSKRTIEDDWRMARSWLRVRLEKEPGS